MKYITRHTAVVMIGMLIAGSLLMGWVVKHKDADARERLLYNARLTAEAVNPHQIRALTGTAADLISQDYLRLKEHLARTKAANNKCRFVYLMGLRKDRSVFFFADSEPSGSRYESPPGQLYSEISATDRRVFDETLALTTGPTSDRWGVWVSALAPVSDPRTGELVAVLGMDFSAEDWKKMLITASLPPLLLTLVLVVWLGAVSIYFGHKRGFGEMAHRFRNAEILWIVAVSGMFLSASVAWIAYQEEVRDRKNTFRQLAVDRTTGIARTLNTLLDVELEALSRFYEASDDVSAPEFREYADYLTKNPAVHVWEWIEPVPASRRELFEDERRSEQLSGFEIWEKDSNGNRITAKARGIYYPVIRVMPWAENEGLLGFDQGSEPLFRAALADALSARLSTCSDPVSIANEAGGEKSILVCKPVFNRQDRSRLLGFVAAILEPGAVLKSVNSNKTVLLSLSLARPEGGLEVLAASANHDGVKSADFSITRPVFIFGRSFLVNAHAGPEFQQVYPSRAPWLVLTAGLVLTILVISLTHTTLRRRLQLEQLVDERTAKLNEAEHRIELAIHGADLGIWDWNVPAREVVFNSHWAEKMGFTQKAVHDVTTWANAVCPEDKPAVMELIARHLKGKTDYYEMEHRIRNNSGDWIWVLVKGRVIKRNTDGFPLQVCGTYLDITQRKQAEEEHQNLQAQLVQVQKMDAVGRLAGGVAHDLNNLLSPIIGYCELMILDLPDGDERYEFLEAILGAGLRAKELVHQLLAFSRKQTLIFKTININEIIGNFENLLRRTIPENIEIQIRLAPDMQYVNADTGQFEQVLMNLAVNAAYAMPDGGKLTIETAMMELDPNSTSAEPGMKPGLYAMMVVSDTGFGMDEETRQRIFEPFFSTKGESGTGLGLATVFGIIQQHEGHILVTSEPGKGTTFRVCLPISDQTPAENKAPRQYGDFRGTETILLVEDDDAVRHLANSILERQGYQVLCADSGDSALSMAASHDGPVHLLLTDVIMPGMNGKELYRKFLNDYPDLKVLYMSGYAQDVIANRRILEEGVPYIQKPFHLDQLISRVREVFKDNARFI